MFLRLAVPLSGQFDPEIGTKFCFKELVKNLKFEYILRNFIRMTLKLNCTVLKCIVLFTFLQLLSIVEVFLNFELKAHFLLFFRHHLWWRWSAFGIGWTAWQFHYVGWGTRVCSLSPGKFLVEVALNVCKKDVVVDQKRDLLEFNFPFSSSLLWKVLQQWKKQLSETKL